MKYFAILRDSLREALDTKVIYVTIGISFFVLLVMATLTFEPNPPDQGLQKITERFPDGSIQVDVPILGKIRATTPLVEYKVADLNEQGGSAKPWENEYRFTLEATDVAPQGFRTTVLLELMRAEEEQAVRAGTGRKTRWSKLFGEINGEAKRLENSPEFTNLGESAKQQKLIEELQRFLARRLQDEIAGLKKEELESFVRQQLENQGNWTVGQVGFSAAEPMKIKQRVVVPEGAEGRIKTEEVAGERNRLEVALSSRSGTYRVWPHKARLFFGAVPLGSSRQPGSMVFYIQKYLVNSVGASVIMLLSCVVTSFFIPNMLRKGTIDMLLAKPIHRWTLLGYKYVGGLTFMFLNTVVIVGGFWLIIGLRTGIWELGMILMIFILTFQFALFYALSTLLAVLTRSPIVSILGCMMLWALLFGVGWAFYIVNGLQSPTGDKEDGILPQWVVTSVQVVHAVLPRYSDLDQLGEKMLYTSLLDPSEAELKKLDTTYKSYFWDEAFYVTLAWIVVMLGLSCWWFTKRDY
jgi:ABC-type transport system involved in multi-copper enzyme maturation permease subunit